MEPVIYITKQKVFVSYKGKTTSISWGGQNLKAVFKAIKQKIKITQANIVLGNDLSYTLALNQTNLENRGQILEIAKEFIPDNLDDHNFDWQKKADFIQVVATSTKVINSLSLAAKINKIKLNSIQTAAAILANSTTSIKYPHLIIHQDQESLIVASFKGVALLAHNQPGIEIDSLVNIASIIKQKYGLDIKGVIVSGSHIDKSIDVPAQWEVVKKNINIMATAAKKKNTSTKDKDELEIKPVSDPVEEPKVEEPKIEEPTEDSPGVAEVVEPEPVVDATSAPALTPEISFDQDDSELKPEKTSNPKSNKGLFVALAITLIVGGALTGGILYSRSASTNQDIRSKAAETPEAVVTEVVTETPTPTPEEIDLSKYTLQIQNGSGTAGQAGAVDELLQAEGFAEAETANADSYDYEDTEVQLKAGTPKAVYSAIERALNSDYTVVSADTLEENSDFDVVIVVGQKI
jgi:hypothetical protein